MFNNNIYIYFLIVVMLVLTLFISVNGNAATTAPQPVKILVYDFTFSPYQVKVDESAIARSKHKNESEYSRKIAVGKQVATNVTNELVKQLRDLGLTAERATTKTPSTFKDNAIVIQGHFNDIEEGNRSRRILIGFSNSSLIASNVQIIRVVNSKQQLLTQFQASEKTIPKPGIIPMIAIGAATGRIVEAAIVSTTLSSASEINPKLNKLAKMTAKDIVSQIKPYFKK